MRPSPKRDEVEQFPLSKAGEYLLDECRMVRHPGADRIPADNCLQSGLRSEAERGGQRLYVLVLVLVAIAVAIGNDPRWRDGRLRDLRSVRGLLCSLVRARPHGRTSTGLEPRRAVEIQSRRRGEARKRPHVLALQRRPALGRGVCSAPSVSTAARAVQCFPGGFLCLDVWTI
jgi:hypothetical protein